MHVVFRYHLALVVLVTGICADGIVPACENVTLVSRTAWGARDPRAKEKMPVPVSLVFIHHTFTPECFTEEHCSQQARQIQNYHMNVKGWDDIAYSFLVGQDGRAYEGRGWDTVGSHTHLWNNISLGFSVMGNYTDKVPDRAALDMVHAMIDCGVQLGKITPDYKLYGHRDACPYTPCPGQCFYELIQTWPHYGPLPPVRPTPRPISNYLPLRGVFKNKKSVVIRD